MFATYLRGDRPSRRSRAARLAFEPLEPRLPLSAAGLVDVGTQPEGGLSGKIVYIHGGHGYTADNEGNGEWSFQRLRTVRDDRRPGQRRPDDVPGRLPVPRRGDGRAAAAGRPSDERGRARQRRRGRHVCRHLVEQYAPRFISAARATCRIGSPRHRSPKRRTPAISRISPQAGFYPVYAWTSSGGDRATDQLYRVNHSGGITEVTVNHRRVGNGLVYLGTYYFEAGTGGYVDISNRSSAAGGVGDRRHDPLRQRHGRHRPRRRRLRAAARGRSRPVLGQVARRSLAGHSPASCSTAAISTRRSRCHRRRSRRATPST